MRFAVYTTYYAERKAQLLRECLLPLARRVAQLPGVERCYLERHWRFAPHVRVCVVASGPDVQPRVEAELGAIHEFLARHPSRRELEPQAYLALSARLGSEELVPAPYGPMWPDNHCFVGPHEPRLDLYGNQHALDLVELHHSRALEPIAAFLEHTAGDETRKLAYALAVLVLAAESFPLGGLFLGQLSLRSHVEEFLHQKDPDGRLRAGFAARFRRTQAQLVPLVESIDGQVAHGRYRGSDPVLRAFGGLLEAGLRDSMELAAARHIVEDPTEALQRVAAGVSEPARRYWAFEATRSYSPFHTELRRLNFLPERVRTVEFSAFRWIVNLLYVAFPLLDVSPLERLFLGYAVAESSELLYGTTWRQHLQETRETVRAKMARDRRRQP